MKKAEFEKHVIQNSGVVVYNNCTIIHGNQNAKPKKTNLFKEIIKALVKVGKWFGII